MTKEEYFVSCSSFDWGYENSDDYRIWRECKVRHQELHNLAQANGWIDVYNAWRLFTFSGVIYGKPAEVKPSWNDFKEK